jgi:3-hydroxyisobutyrate dehydrogenase-like beta-hydroxyacid dehydrogenase
MTSARVTLVGYGEVGRTLGRALQPQGPAALRAYDLQLGDPKRRDAMVQRVREDGVVPIAPVAAAVEGADLVICAVTADQTLAAARAAAPGLRANAFYVDLNSASPKTKCECAALVHAAKGRYVEMAVMTSIPPYGIRVPMLSGGPHATAAAPLLAELGFKVEHASDKLGVASAIKMCRSVIVKGMEALVIESFLSARRYGVEREVLASLAETFPGIDWEKNGSYFFQRVVAHGRRRAEEMREAAVTVGEAGLEPVMASAIAERQAWMAALKEAGAFEDVPRDAAWRELADRIARGESAPQKKCAIPTPNDKVSAPAATGPPTGGWTV